LAAALLVALCLGLSPNRAEAKSGEAISAMRAIFLHELGHGLIDVLNLTVVGPEEDVVDEFSTYMLILTGRTQERQIEALFSTARFWAAAAKQRGSAFPHWGEHPPQERRAYAIICLLYGSDPGRFYPVITNLGIPQSRARKCEFEYAEKEQKWLQILSPHLRSADNPGAGAFKTVYSPAQNQAAADIALLWRQTRFLESLAIEAGSIFSLPKDIAVIGRECGFANAFWDGQSITLCYEMQHRIEELLAGEDKPADDGHVLGSGAEAASQSGGSGGATVGGEGRQNLGGALGQSQ
jgi:hypothetical protein